ANIRGKVSTGPGGRVDIGPNGKVGDATWFGDATATGFQTGSVRDDMNVDFKDAGAPYNSGTPPILGIYNLTTYDYKLGTDNYYLSSLVNKTVVVTGNATLYVAGNINMTG